MGRAHTWLTLALSFGGQTLAYTFYVLVVLLLMGWFGRCVTQAGDDRGVRPGLFYSFVGFLVVLGVSLHYITYLTIPWKPMDMHRATSTPDKVFDIGTTPSGSSARTCTSPCSWA